MQRLKAIIQRFAARQQAIEQAHVDPELVKLRSQVADALVGRRFTRPEALAKAQSIRSLDDAVAMLGIDRREMDNVWHRLELLGFHGREIENLQSASHLLPVRLKDISTPGWKALQELNREEAAEAGRLAGERAAAGDDVTGVLDEDEWAEILQRVQQLVDDGTFTEHTRLMMHEAAAADQAGLPWRTEQRQALLQLAEASTEDQRQEFWEALTDFSCYDDQEWTQTYMTAFSEARDQMLVMTPS